MDSEERAPTDSLLGSQDESGDSELSNLLFGNSGVLLLLLPLLGPLQADAAEEYGNPEIATLASINCVVTGLSVILLLVKLKQPRLRVGVACLLTLSWAITVICGTLAFEEIRKCAIPWIGFNAALRSATNEAFKYRGKIDRIAMIGHPLAVLSLGSLVFFIVGIFASEDDYFISVGLTTYLGAISLVTTIVCVFTELKPAYVRLKICTQALLYAWWTLSIFLLYFQITSDCSGDDDKWQCATFRNASFATAACLIAFFLIFDPSLVGQWRRVTALCENL